MLAPKSIALLIVGVIIISTLFSVFQVTYPTGNPVVPPIQPKQYQLFKVQFNDKNLLGNSSTSFVPTGNGSVTIEGYVYSSNGTVSKPIGNSYLYAAVFPAESDFYTTASGFFQITVIKYGHGTFAFQVPGYNSKLFKISLYGSSVYWLNITLQKAEKYNVSGSTIDSAGHVVTTANLTFSDFIQTFSAESSKTGTYSLSLYNGTYIISDLKRGFSPQPTPYMLTINGAGKSGFDITLKPLSTPSYYVSGYVHNVPGMPIKGAVVTSSTIASPSQTNSSGYYQIEVPFGANIIMAYATGYGYNYTPIYVQTNMTDVNMTLTNNNPFGNSGPTSINGTGLSGIPPGAVKNITGTLGNNTSNVSYGNNTTSGGSSGGTGAPGSPMLLFGNVTNSNNSARVVDTYLYFYIDVNGTYFYEGVKTNSTGFYSLAISYKGHYNFYVYSPLYENYTFGMWINSTSEKNITLTPVPGTVFKVSGTLTNRLDGQGIPGTVTVYPYGTLKPMLASPATSSGNYVAYLVEGNYSMEATSPGFAPDWNNTSMQPLSGDLLKDFSLAPVSSLGNGVSLWNQNGSTGLPGVSSSNISSQLSNSSGGNTIATGVNSVNLTVQMVNASNGLPLANTPYDMFLKLNGVDYSFNGTTNATGNSTIVLGYEGNYTLLAEMFYYYGKAISLNITGDTGIVMDMYPRAVHSLNITLANAYNITSGVNVTVPADYLNITNYKQSLYRMPAVIMIAGVGTVFNYTLPKGNYSFAYSNVNYVTHSFYANVSDSYNSSTQLIKPYLVIVNSSASTSLLQYTISQLAIYSVTVPANTSYQRFYAATGGVQYIYNAFLGGNTIENQALTLTSSRPVDILYLNITGNSQQDPQDYWNVNPVNSATVSVVTNYNFTGGSSQYVYLMSSDYNFGSGLTVSVNGIIQNGIAIGTSTVAFNLYYAVNANYLNISFQSSYSTSGAPSLQQLQGSVLTVYYYTPSYKLVTSSGGI